MEENRIEINWELEREKMKIRDEKNKELRKAIDDCESAWMTGSAAYVLVLLLALDRFTDMDSFEFWLSVIGGPVVAALAVLPMYLLVVIAKRIQEKENKIIRCLCYAGAYLGLLVAAKWLQGVIYG